MSKHTPGPWEIDINHVEYVQQVGREDVGICSVLNIDEYEDEEGSGDWFHGPVTEANARLIAAAPDLLAALELAESVYRLNVVQPGEPSSVLDAMQAAISKAKGGAA